MNSNLKRELAWYKLALEAYTTGMGVGDGVCITLMCVTTDFKAFWHTPHTRSRDLLPTLYEESILSNPTIFWFENNKERVEALKRCITKLTNQLYESNYPV